MTIDFDDPLPASTPRAPAPGPAIPLGEPAGLAGAVAVPAMASSPAAGPAPASAAAASASAAPSADAGFQQSGFDPPAPAARTAPAVVSASPPVSVLPSLLLSALLRAVNHVLRQQGWARERLRPFAGRSVLLAVDPASPLHRAAPPLRTQITADGLLEAAAAPSASAADVSLWLRPGPTMLLDGLSSGPRGLSAHLRVDGDVMLAAAMGDLAGQLRWDAEEDVSRLLGDIPARRLFAGLAQLRDRFGRTRSNLERSAVQYLTVEDPQLLSGAELAGHAAELAVLQQRLDWLEGRLAQAAARR